MYAKEIDKFYQLPLIKIVLLLGIVTGTHGHLTDTPWNSVVLKGKTNVFTCCSDIQETLFWKHKPVGSPDANDIYDSRGFVNGYLTSGRFNVTSGSSRGCHSLTTTNVSRGDEGTYICTDDAGLGQWKGWELVILESFDCQEKNRKDEYMGVNDFGLPQDVISTECIFKYFGNIRPKPMCEWTSGTQKLDNYQEVTETNFTTTLNIHIPAIKEMNGDQLSCIAKIDNRNATTWKSTKFNINYALIRQKRVSQCNREELSLDCQPQCSYNMGQFSNGSTYCEITYPSETNPKCYVLLQDLQGSTFLPSSESGTVPNILAAIVAGLVVSILMILSAGAFVIYCCLKRHCPQQSIGRIETGMCKKCACCETRHQEANISNNDTGQQTTDHPESKNANPVFDPLL